MEDVFNTISYKARMEDRNKIYSELNFKSVPQLPKEGVQEVSMGKYPGQNPTTKTYNGPNHRSKLTLVSAIGNITTTGNVSQPHRVQDSYQANHGQRKLMCYYCEGEHHIRDCEKFTKDKAKYKL